MPQKQDSMIAEVATAKRLIVEHVTRYRMTTYDALLQLRGVRQFGIRRLKRLLRELCTDGVLGRQLLYHQKHYFFLASNGVSSTKGAGRRSGPLSTTAKIHNYALPGFCCRSGVFRTRLTKTELSLMLPKIDRSGLPLNYYVDTSGESPRLGFVRVDSGGSGRWDRAVERCRDDLNRHISDRAFRLFIERRTFEVALITATPQKADRICRVIVDLCDESAEMLHVVAFPELVNLIAPPPVAVANEPL